ncbi:unnamed protein product [Effrenium voratum]|uniref:Uncharacterized protein n=1 Tax=Effrenium voratum TaxID=2562239 RepID=A0AA36N4T0_9DINO|nr:unnamed protein product [Effrenium voratum]CAJ1416111.1 unnamed protein product [Effrenium voratum]
MLMRHTSMCVLACKFQRPIQPRMSPCAVQGGQSPVISRVDKHPGEQRKGQGSQFAQCETARTVIAFALSFARTEANKKQQLTRQPISCVDLSTTNTATSTAAVVNWVVPARKAAAAVMPFFAMLMRHTSIFVLACEFQSLADHQ